MGLSKVVKVVLVPAWLQSIELSSRIFSVIVVHSEYRVSILNLLCVVAWMHRTELNLPLLPSVMMDYLT